jgi:hypothetical protein
MQSELNETSQNIHPLNPESIPFNTSQHGFLPQDLPPAELHDPREGAQSCGGNAHELSSNDDSPSPQRIGRLSLRDSNENRPRPSFQQISEYENALANSARRNSSEGPTFKVIKTKRNRLDGPQLNNFPNGIFCFSFVLLAYISIRSILMLLRGLDSYLVTFAGNVSGCCLSGLPTILYSSYDPTCVAHRVHSLLSRLWCF